MSDLISNLIMDFKDLKDSEIQKRIDAVMHDPTSESEEIIRGKLQRQGFDMRQVTVATSTVGFKFSALLAIKAPSGNRLIAKTL